MLTLLGELAIAQVMRFFFFVLENFVVYPYVYVIQYFYLSSTQHLLNILLSHCWATCPMWRRKSLIRTLFVCDVNTILTLIHLQAKFVESISDT